MRVVAIARLATSVQAEAQALATYLGTLAYDERQKLSAGLPAIVLSTPDAARAEALDEELRSRGHGTVGCDSSEVVPSSAMISLRDFRFDDHALIAATETADHALPWSDVAVILRGTRRTYTTTTRVVNERRLAIGKAIITGGMAPTKMTSRDEISRADEAEPVLYLFRHSAAPPWILALHGARFGALGAAAVATAAPNFLAAVDRLRICAPTACFDDRLLTRKTTPVELDLLAHLLAKWIATTRPSR